ncbi:MAG: hypothetical protein ACERKZ_03835 [Lachnotalea sp.]
MTEYKIGETFEEMEYEEMASSQAGVDSITFLTITVTWCPLPITITTIL